MTVCTNAGSAVRQMDKQREGGSRRRDFHFLTDGTAAESEMSPVSMAANEIIVCIRIRRTRTKP